MLTNPYFAYPGFPMSPYQDYSYFNPIVQNLYGSIIEQINKLKANKNKIIFHMTFGAAAEELSVELGSDIGHQWQQLFPEHLQSALKNKQEIMHFIVCPSRTFNYDRDYVPLFIKQTPEFNWIKLACNIYKSSVHNITIKIFNCPMPSEYDYTEIIKKLKSRNICDEDYYLQINQTQIDKNFIKCFYNELNNLFDQVVKCGGFVSCFSFAVFNDESDKRIYNNYYMFKEIKKLFVDKFNKCNKLLAEWVYIIDFYNVVIYNHDNNLLCFVDIEKLSINSIDNFNGKKQLLLNLSSDIMSVDVYNKNIKNNLDLDLDLNKLYIAMITYFKKDITCSNDLKYEIITLKERVWELLNKYYGTKKLLEHLHKQNYFSENPNADVIEKFKEYITQINNNNNIIYDLYELNVLSLIFMTNIKIINNNTKIECYIDNKFDNIIIISLNLGSSPNFIHQV